MANSMIQCVMIKTNKGKVLMMQELLNS